MVKKPKTTGHRIVCKQFAESKENLLRVVDGKILRTSTYEVMAVVECTRKNHGFRSVVAL